MVQSIAGVCYTRDYVFLLRARGGHGKNGILKQSRPAHTYLPIDRRRWSLASRACGRYSLHHINLWELPDLLRDRMPNWPRDFKINSIIDDIIDGVFQERLDLDGNFVAFLAAFTIAGFLYGGLHLIAWNSPFPSRTQRLLWRISGIAIAASGPAALILKLISFNVARIMDAGDTLMEIVVLVFFIFYLFARTYLIIECFLSFAYLPPSIIQQPVWSQYFPHI